MATSSGARRRGLPRTAGGEPWPPAAPVVAAPTFVAPPAAVAPTPASGHPLRRGLPRVAGGDPWPPAGSAPARVVGDPVVPVDRAEPPAPRAERPTRRSWIGAVAIGLVALVVLAALVVLGARRLLSLAPLREFLETYPGTYRLPAVAPVGIPAWIGWQHVLTVFLMALIIRSGLRVRSEKRPPALWAPRRHPDRRISLTVWFHQSLDLLWLVNGVVFIVLLFATGQWMRIVPTSWDVVPNALSAVLQYLSLDWPTENGWVAYNSLQQLTYFAVVFLAAPLAAVTGVRMSGLWPKRAVRLSRVYRVEWARAVHFPLMLFFCVFIVVHVALVLATGALRNLDHMYAARGSADPAAFAGDWLGFGLFVLSLAVTAAAVVAARPVVLAPIARLFGTVTAR